MTEREPEHEPIVSETLERNAERQNRRAEATEETTRKVAGTRERLRSEPEGEPRDGAPADAQSADLEESEGPNKQHGDALEHGSGNRHGVHQADREPDTRR